LIDHLTKQVVFRSSRVFDLDHELGPDPMHTAQHER